MIIPFQSYNSLTVFTNFENGIVFGGQVSAKHGEWLKYFGNNLFSRDNYVKGALDGLRFHFNSNNLAPNHISYYDDGQRLFQIRIEKDKPVEIWKEEPDAFVAYNEDEQTIEYGYLNNGEKAGIWRKWDIEGVLLEEIDYDLQP